MSLRLATVQEMCAAPWSAVAAATAFLALRPLHFCRMNRKRKAVAAATALKAGFNGN